MGLEQAPTKSEQGSSPPERSTLRDDLPVQTLAGSLDFTPRPTKVADMGVGSGSGAGARLVPVPKSAMEKKILLPTPVDTFTSTQTFTGRMRAVSMLFKTPPTNRF